MIHCTPALIIVAAEDDDEPFTTGPRLAKAISINLKSIISATDSPPRSPPPTTYHSPPGTQSTSAAVVQLIDSAPTPTLGASKVALVDYPDEDSDEEGDGEGVTATKRSRVEATNT